MISATKRRHKHRQWKKKQEKRYVERQDSKCDNAKTNAATKTCNIFDISPTVACHRIHRHNFIHITYTSRKQWTFLSLPLSLDATFVKCSRPTNVLICQVGGKRCTLFDKRRQNACECKSKRKKCSPSASPKCVNGNRKLRKKTLLAAYFCTRVWVNSVSIVSECRDSVVLWRLWITIFIEGNEKTPDPLQFLFIELFYKRNFVHWILISISMRFINLFVYAVDLPKTWIYVRKIIHLDSSMESTELRFPIEDLCALIIINRCVQKFIFLPKMQPILQNSINYLKKNLR